MILWDQVNSLVPYNLLLVSTEYPCLNPLLQWGLQPFPIYEWAFSCKDELPFSSPPHTLSSLTVETRHLLQEIKVERERRRGSSEKGISGENHTVSTTHPSSARGLPLHFNPGWGWGVARLLILFKTWPSRLGSIVVWEPTHAWEI